MSRKKALHKGANRGELLRVKDTLRKQNELIQKSKQIKPKASETEIVIFKF